MSETCKTIKVVAPVTDENPLGYVIINESDLIEGQQLFDDKTDPATVESAKMTVPQIKEALTAAGIPFESNATKGDLLLLLTANKQG